MTPNQACAYDYIKAHPGCCRFDIACDPSSGLVKVPGSAGAKRAVWRAVLALVERGEVVEGAPSGVGGRKALYAA